MDAFRDGQLANCCNQHEVGPPPPARFRAPSGTDASATAYIRAMLTGHLPVPADQRNKLQHIVRECLRDLLRRSPPHCPNRPCPHWIPPVLSLAASPGQTGPGDGLLTLKAVRDPLDAMFG
jgi:hypothetical protein